MSNEYDDIRALLLEVTNKGELPVWEAEVLSVNDDRTCKVKVIRTDLELDNVRVQGLANYTTGIYPRLKVGTKGVVMLVGKAAYMIITGETDELQLNGSQHGGLIIISSLISKINIIENKVNTIISTFNAHAHAGVTTGTGTSATPATPVSGTLTNTQASDIENENVRHG